MATVNVDAKPKSKFKKTVNSGCISQEVDRKNLVGERPMGESGCGSQDPISWILWKLTHRIVRVPP